MPHLEHIGIAVEDVAAVADLYATLLDALPYKVETVAEQGVRTHFLSAETAKVEFLEALGADSPIARFLERRGEGLHHVAFEVDDIEATMEDLRERGFEPLSDTPRPGADDKRIFFLHPKQTHGVLVEFCQSTPTPLDPTHVPYDGDHLVVYERGHSEAPPLLLLHGAAGCTQLETAPLLRRLEPHFHVLALDFSGHGASPFPVGDFSADLFADNVRATLDHFEIPQPHVFGFSMGGYIALHFAHHYPDRVDRIAVHGVNVQWDDERVTAMTHRLDAASIANHPERAQQLDTVHHDWHALFQRTAAFIRTLPDQETEMREILTQIHHPTLVSAVDDDDIFPMAAPLELHERLPNSHLALLPGDRHALAEVDLSVLIPLLRSHVQA